MRRLAILTLMMALVIPALPAQAQEALFPLPAPLYLLTSDHTLLRVDPVSGAQTPVSPPEQPIADFAISPDGAWYAYRTTSNNVIVVSEINTGSGFVLEFSDYAYPDSSPRQTIAWSPDAAAIAYTLPGGLRIAELGVGEYGGAVFSDIQGPWVELYWNGPELLIASDEAGSATRISGKYQQWTVEAAPGAPPRQQSPVPSDLTAGGVTLNGAPIPRTAGALSFVWGPTPLAEVAGLSLPADLHFTARDANDILQVWRAPQSGAPAQAVTAESADIQAFAVHGDQIAYIVSNMLVVTDGAARRIIAQPQAGERGASVDWRADGAWLAYHDARGVWVAPADGSQPARMLLAHNLPRDQQNAVEVQVYLNPRWSPDGARLLVTVGLWEGSVMGVIDAESGALTQPVGGYLAGQNAWTSDGRLLAWAAYWGYVTPGLFVADPAAPDTEASPVLPVGTPVMDVAQRPGGDWVVLVASTADIGPRYLRALGADTLSGPFGPVDGNTAGGFIEDPQVSAGPTIMVAGLRNMTRDEQGHPSGNLAVLDLSSGATVVIQTPGPVFSIQWGR